MHDPAYLETVFSLVPLSGWAQLDSDTFLSPGSGEAILRAAGAVILAIDMVFAGQAANAFCAVRPPGHHAPKDRAMGFCAINNVAVGAAYARARHGVKRVAVVDFDVHHGNGTEALFYDDAALFYASTHQSPLYPGTGRAEETGVAGNIVNCPLPAGAGGREFRQVFSGTLFPALARFAPELILVSAGFDAHRDDPLASLCLDESDFGWATERLCALAAEQCQGRVVSALEGAMTLEALAASAQTHVQALMNA